MSGIATVREAALHYESSGRGPDLVWGHGLTSSRAADDELGFIDHEQLATVCRLHRYDARGHGASESTTDLDAYGWDQLALDQLALADHLGVGPYVAGGASMGAGTALHVAVTAPERVRGLVLMIPPTGWETRAEQVDLYVRMAGVIEDVGVEPVIAAASQMPSPDPFAGRSDWKDRSARSMRAADAQRLARVLRGAAHADLPPRDAVSAIEVPTLVLAWTGDPGHPAGTAEELGALISGSEVHLASTYEALMRWSGQIVAFVRELGEL